MPNIFSDFIQNKGLYDNIEITKDNLDMLIDLVGGNVKIDEYCIHCKAKRVFSMHPIETKSMVIDRNEYHFPLAEKLNEIKKKAYFNNNQSTIKWDWNDDQTIKYTRLMCFSFYCSMCDEHKIDYIVRTDGNKMTKIGQYPSTASLTFPELDTYKKIIDIDMMKELKLALGLYANGVGAGSYVYLRRIFENILDLAKDKAIKNNELSEEEYKKARMNEKIQMLKEYLPKAINDNKQIYGIVSKGIHELSEEDCIKHFPVLKTCIFMILKQWNDISEREKLEKEMLKSLNDINSKLSK